uniref:Uncharacterized protein n=1 Tax=Myotis myotis TaxID=51298 RepID=A0A7J7VJ55_MYOMY|nr:hypothetical protein mMyoMyo1_008403 [Myotis myotis]
MAAEEPQQQKQEPLGSDAEGVNCLAYDEAIMAQQDRIQQEIAVQNPLVSERLELSVLYKEYAEDDKHVQRFLCGCKWSYFTPPSLSYNLPRFIKGDAGGEPCVRVPALLLPAWMLCVWLTPPPGGFLSAFHLSASPAVLRG